jgi:peptide-methionine (R)-S-oxide reductase
MKNEKKIYPIQVNEEELKAKLDSPSYHVLREKGTERAFTGEYYLNKETGIYECKVCGNDIFHSANKYDSGCGWPSFTEPVSPEAIDVHMDYSHLTQLENSVPINQVKSIISIYFSGPKCV